MLSVIWYVIYDNTKYTKEQIIVTNYKLELLLNQNAYIAKNIAVLGDTTCYFCHNNVKMFLPKSNLKLEEFVKYVRGDRFVTNSVMQVFTENDISYEKLQEIWKTLY